jgi:hypothetical protein
MKELKVFQKKERKKETKGKKETVLIQCEYSSSYIINKPVNSFKKILSCNSTAPYNLPMMSFD